MGKELPNKENIKENINVSKLNAGEGSRSIIQLALKEDLGSLGDLSSLLTIEPNKQASAQIIAKEPGIMACSWIIQAILETYCVLAQRSFSEVGSLQLPLQDSDAFQAGDIVCEIKAPAQMLLACERTILNFLQRLCGIATYTRNLVNLIKDYPCKLLDTRKTMPGMRLLEKEAFHSGGGTNHRLDLSDMIMLKENHLACIEGDLIQAINQMRQALAAKDSTKNTQIEIEINKDNLSKLDSVIQASVDIIMLDNFSPNEASKLVSSIRSKNKIIKIELSGGVTASNLVDYAKALPDYISTGSATTKANNLDLSMIVK